ncbi:hypothetical protein AJ79_10161 [Helicocarpus griseus UAMH5409]|uniref:Homeobox domain-containing protein n=1 Tax=Helicocarpus griseus UAMH5409 TaxID=1447875 RepID=A0A2B7WFJ7_9EURO|nr:hypothetical protein AJ79_10161 [Helicocarpus griseus UAMH5409]
MNYLHHPFPFGGSHAIPVDHQHVGYGVPIRHPQLGHPVDTYLLPHAPIDIAEYYHHAAAIEDYDEYTENLSRPRLTKEQVDTLEAQFQAHPKPNSNVKRQLAAQTNLTLPRVANWFQNRRAKAKQQKRQEEFERMQASENGEQWKNSNQNSQQEVKSEERTEQPDSSTTPTQDRASNSPPASPASPLKKNEQSTTPATNQSSGSSEKATDSEMSANAQFNRPGNFNKPIFSDVKYRTSQSPLGTETDSTLTSGLSDWNGNEENSAIWASQNAGDNFGYTHVDRHQSVSTDNPVEIHVHESPQFPSIRFNHELDGWESHNMPNLMGKRPSIQDQNDGFHPIPFHSLHSSLFAEEQRRSSYSSEQSELADTLFHTDINGVVETSPRDPSHMNHLAQLHHHVEPSTNWRYPEKEVDIAARRKRPRPAAIGTSSLARSYGPSSMSPTTRIPCMGAGHVLRHAKSTQNLSPNHNPRYPGIRKASVPQRSPLGMASFAEAGRFNHANAADMMSQVPGLVTTSLAPPTPLTPEDLQTLLPPTPNDSSYSVSPTDDMGCSRFFPMSQSMQVHTESPPDTPLHLGVLSHLQYQPMGLPMSASAQCTSFQDYSLSVPTNQMGSGLWPDTSSMSAPESSQLQQPTIHMPQPTHISPITYGESVDSGNTSVVDEMTSRSESPRCTVKSSSTPPPPPKSSTPGSQKVTEFFIQEFPEQQEAHRRAAQQLPPQKPMNYTFSNHTPNDFSTPYV